ncbi:serine/threonine-protein kinase DCLK1-like isoform X1 [Lytechinus variegatus]|uniref:serine/threonine-protein kinase DCLK1-like isoform X1 n=1 Tax=Lytechinus variegatus TaxID=7654 RepID=UPI001BB261B6|nr:serine/threonine-protein kinase DCLK1-like isoform X1 [Lytechinus variegatus]
MVGWHHPGHDTLLQYPIPSSTVRARKSKRRPPHTDPPTAMATSLSPRSLHNDRVSSLSMPTNMLSPRSIQPSEVSPRTMAAASQQLHDLTREQYQERRRPRQIIFYRNGDRFFKGKKMLITPHRYTSFEDLLSDLTRNMKLPYGVRQIFTPDGTKVRDIEELKNGESYVCASFERLKKLKYTSSTGLPGWNTGTQRRDPKSDAHLYTHIPVGLSYPTEGKYAEMYGRTTFGSGHTGPGSFAHHRNKAGASLDGDSKALGILHSDRSPIKPRVVKIVKTGPKPRKMVSLLINKRSVQSYEQLIQDVSDAFGLPKYKNNRVRKLYTVKGKEVKSLVDFYRDKEGVFIASPSRSSLSEDTFLDIYEELFPDSPYAQNFRKRKGKKKDGAKHDSGISDEEVKIGKNKRDRNKLKDSDSRLNDSRGSDLTTDGSNINQKDSDWKREEELERRRKELEERMQGDIKKKESELQQREEELRLKEEELKRKEQGERERKDREREDELARKEAELKAKEEELKRREKEEGQKLQELLEADAQRKIEEARLKAQALAEREAREAAERRAADEASRREEAERNARLEIEKRKRDEEDLKRKEEAERRGRLEAEINVKEKEARRASAERRAREEAERRIQQEQRLKEKEEAEREAREAERLAREEAQSRALSEKQARDEAERKAEEALRYKEGQEEERRKREEAERLAQLEADLRKEVERRAEEDSNQKDSPSPDSQTDGNDNIVYKQDESNTPTPETPEERFIHQPRTLVKKSDILVKYDIGAKIGDGNFADVHEATKKETGDVFALKVIEKAKVKNKEHMVENEIAIMKHVRHPNIVRLYEEYETRGHIYLVMEYVTGGDLFDAITESVKFTERDAALMVTDLAKALKYLHDLNVVHRDLKPENLLVNKSESGEITLKLADFGLAMEVKAPIYTVCGTPTYVAPEILGETGYGLEVDMWAIGVITYILLCGFPPFRSPDRDQEELFELIQAGEFSYVSPYWDNISSAAKDLINHLLVVDKEKRYTAGQVLKHPWVTSEGAAGKQINLQREVSMNLEKNFKDRRSAKRKPVAPKN